MWPCRLQCFLPPDSDTLSLFQGGASYFLGSKRLRACSISGLTTRGAANGGDFEGSAAGGLGENGRETPIGVAPPRAASAWWSVGATAPSRAMFNVETQKQRHVYSASSARHSRARILAWSRFSFGARRTLTATKKSVRRVTTGGG